MRADKTKKGHESDVMQVFEVLKKCVVVLVVQIKNRWKFPELRKCAPIYLYIAPHRSTKPWQWR